MTVDLNENKFTGPLCSTFSGHVVQLSKQKFSSNVIEKVIFQSLYLRPNISNASQSMRMADAHWQRQMVHELLMNPADMEILLKDPFANYVVQTAVC
jgi:hypothetical protein